MSTLNKMSAPKCQVKRPYRQRKLACEAEFASPGSTLAFNHVIGAPYKKIRLLGSGGFGSVELAEDRRSGDRVAIKYLRDEESAAEEVAMFRAIRSARSCPASLPCYLTHYYDSARGQYAIVQTLAPGTVASKYFKPISETVDSFSKLFVRFVADITAAVAFLHRRAIFHGDIKPENMMVNPHGPSTLLDVGGGCIMTKNSGFINSCYLNWMAGTEVYMTDEYRTARDADVYPGAIPNVALMNDAWALGLSFVYCVSAGANRYRPMVSRNKYSLAIFEEVRQRHANAKTRTYSAVCGLVRKSAVERLRVVDALKVLDDGPLSKRISKRRRIGAPEPMWSFAE